MPLVLALVLTMMMVLAMVLALALALAFVLVVAVAAVNSGGVAVGPPLQVARHRVAHGAEADEPDGERGVGRHQSMLGKMALQGDRLLTVAHSLK